jgi:flagellar biogenesis protein FliO
LDAELARQVGSILLVFALLGAALWLIRRRGSLARAPWRERGRRVRSLSSIERVTLTAQHAVHLLRIEVQGEAREILLATHPQGCTLLNSAALPGEKIRNGAKGAGA